MTDTIKRMPARSVAMFTPPLGRWYAGAVYRWRAPEEDWIKVADLPEEDLLPAQRLMLERIDARPPGDAMNIEVQHNGETVYSGPWQGAPAPVSSYIAAAEKHHGTENLRAYMERKATPVVLGMQGYAVKVL